MTRYTILYIIKERRRIENRHNTGIKGQNRRGYKKRGNTYTEVTLSAEYGIGKKFSHSLLIKKYPIND